MTRDVRHYVNFRLTLGLCSHEVWIDEKKVGNRWEGSLNRDSNARSEAHEIMDVLINLDRGATKDEGDVVWWRLSFFEYRRLTQEEKEDIKAWIESMERHGEMVHYDEVDIVF